MSTPLPRIPPSALRITGNRAPLPWADVYDAVHVPSGRAVVIERVLRAVAGDAEAAGRVVREWSALARIRSPRVERLVGLVDDPAQHAVVRESLPGPTLERTLVVNGPPDVETAIAWATAVAEGLRDCHAEGVLHRNLTSQNVVLTPAGPKLTGFQLVYMEGRGTLTMTGALLVSPAIAPPETFESKPRDLRIDVYAFGLLLWEMLTGRRPFEGLPLAQLIAEKQRVLPPPSAVRPETPAWLDDLVTRCAHPDSGERPPSMVPVLARLHDRRLPAHGGITEGTRCLRCGARSASVLGFCGACGSSRGSGSAQRRLLLAPHVSDPKLTEAVMLDAGFERIGHKHWHRREPVALAANLDPQSIAWLQHRLADVGTPTESAEQERFRLKPLSAALSLIVAAGFALVDTAEFARTLPEKAWQLRALVGGDAAAAGMFGYALLLLSRLEIGLRGLPKAWWAAVRSVAGREPGRDRIAAGLAAAAVPALVLMFIYGLRVVSNSLAVGATGILSVKLYTGLGYAAILFFIAGRLYYRPAFGLRAAAPTVPFGTAAMYRAAQRTLQATAPEPAFRALVHAALERSVACRRFAGIAEHRQAVSVIDEHVERLVGLAGAFLDAPQGPARAAAYDAAMHAALRSAGEAETASYRLFVTATPALPADAETAYALRGAVA